MWLEDDKRMKDLRKSSDGEKWKRLVTSLKKSLEETNELSSSIQLPQRNKWQAASLFYLKIRKHCEDLTASFDQLEGLVKMKHSQAIQQVRSQILNVLDNATSEYISTCDSI